LTLYTSRGREREKEKEREREREKERRMLGYDRRLFVQIYMSLS